MTARAAAAARSEARGVGVVAILVLAAALLLPTLALRGIWPPDETRYADVAQGMTSGGGFVVPQLNGEIYGEKPPIFFWLTAALGAAGVPLPASPRLVSVLAALGTLALVPGIGRRLGGPSALAERGAIVLLAMPLFWAYAQMGLLDALSMFFVTAAVAAKLARADAAGGRRLGLAALEGAVLAAALLTKGPVLLLFPLGLRLGAAAARRGAAPARADRSDLLALAVAVALPVAWLAAAWQGAGGPEYVRAITLGQVVRRVTGDAPHLRPPGFLLATTLAGLLPWSVLGLAALSRERRAAVSAALPGAAALLGWLLVPLGLLSLLRTQQPHYVLPALPAAALLASATLARDEAAPVRRLLSILGVALGGALLAAGLALPAVLGHVRLPAAARDALAADAVLRGALALGGALAIGLAATPLRGGRDAVWRRSAAVSLVLAATAFAAIGRVDPWLMPRALLARPEVRDAARLAAPTSLRSAVRVETGRREVDLAEESLLLERMRAEPGLVALVWRRDLGRIGGAPGEIEEIGAGAVRGRELVAVRLRR